MFPELKDYPEEYHQENLAIQEALRTMLRDGVISGKDDNALIAHIVRDDFILPIWPLWDPEGLVLRQATTSRTIFEMHLARADMGLFNPRKWGVQSLNLTDEQLRFQRKLKGLILRRLYPGLQDQSDDELLKFMMKLSPLNPLKQVVNEVAPLATKRRNQPIQNPYLNVTAADNDRYPERWLETTLEERLNSSNNNNTLPEAYDMV